MPSAGPSTDTLRDSTSLKHPHGSLCVKFLRSSPGLGLVDPGPMRPFRACSVEQAMLDLNEQQGKPR
jgi:hypothetical protein